VISENGFRREKLMKDSMIHVIFVMQIVISKIAESGYARKIFDYFYKQIGFWDCIYLSLEYTFIDARLA
jgi:hypothetical protein